MNKDKVIRKINKLLKLSESPNRHEAENALLKAHELMYKYKIEKSDTHIIRSDIIEKKLDIYYTPYKNTYINLILTVLAKHFMCGTYVSFTSENSTKRYINLIGLKEDVESFEAVIKFIKSYVDEWFRNYKKKVYEGGLDEEQYYKFISFNKDYNATLNSYKNTYGVGFIDGIGQLIEEQRAKIEQETGLILVVDSNIKEYIESLEEDKISKTKCNISNDYIAYAEGYADGVNAPLNKTLR